MIYNNSVLLSKISDSLNHVVLNPIGVSLTVGIVYERIGNELIEVEHLTVNKIKELKEKSVKKFQTDFKATKEFLKYKDFNFLFDSFIDEEKKESLNKVLAKIDEVVDREGSIENVEVKGIQEIEETFDRYEELLKRTNNTVYLLQSNSRYLVVLEQGICNLNPGEFGFFSTTKEVLRSEMSVDSFFVTENCDNLEVFINTNFLKSEEPILITSSTPIIDFMIGRIEE